MNFSEDDLEGLLELSAKTEYKLTFEKFASFLLTDVN